MRRFRKTGIFALLVLVITLIFDFYLIRCQMVPVRFLVPLLLFLLLPTGIVAVLTKEGRKKLFFAAGLMIAVAVCGVLIYGITVLAQITGTIRQITSVTADAANVGAYVLADDDAESINEMKEEMFGILTEVDRSSTDGAISQIEEELGVSLQVKEYDGLLQLADALLNGECRVILLNSAFLEVLEEIEGYEDIQNRIREITVVEVVVTEEPLLFNERADEEGIADMEENAETIADSSGNAFVVYISGIDSRNGLTSRSRSDTNILAVVNPDTHQVLLVSTPRDYYVPLSISGGAKDKLTHAGIYGVSVSMDTLAMLYEIDVDYYIRICFEGLEDVVDALGGVTVYSEYTFSASVYEFSAGYNTLDGKQALAFARARTAFSSGDRQRGKNQMELIKAIIRKALSPEILVTYSSLLSAAADNFETSVPYDLITSLVSDQLVSGADWDIVSYSVDGTGSSQVPWSLSTSAYVMIPDEETVETAKELMNAVLAGELVEEP